MMNGTVCGGCGGYCMGMRGYETTIPFDLPNQISQMLTEGCCFTGCGHQHFGGDPCFISPCSCPNNNLDGKDKSVYAMSYEHPTKDYGNFPRNGLPCEQPPYAWPSLNLDLGNAVSPQSGNRDHQGTSKPTGYDTDSIFSNPQQEDSSRYQMASFGGNNTGHCKPVCPERPKCIRKPNCVPCPPTPCIPDPCVPNCNFRNYMLSGCRSGAIYCAHKFYDERKEASEIDGGTKADADLNRKSLGNDGKEDGKVDGSSNSGQGRRRPSTDSKASGAAGIYEQKDQGSQEDRASGFTNAGIYGQKDRQRRRPSQDSKASGYSNAGIYGQRGQGSGVSRFSNTGINGQRERRASEDSRGSGNTNAGIYGQRGQGSGVVGGVCGFSNTGIYGQRERRASEDSRASGYTNAGIYGQRARLSDVSELRNMYGQREENMARVQRFDTDEDNTSGSSVDGGRSFGRRHSRGGGANQLSSADDNVVFNMVKMNTDLGQYNFDELLQQQAGEFADLRNNQEMELRRLQEQSPSAKLHEQIERLLQKQQNEQIQMEQLHKQQQTAWSDIHVVRQADSDDLRGQILRERLPGDQGYPLVDSHGNILHQGIDGRLLDDNDRPVLGSDGRLLYGPQFGPDGVPLVDNNNGILDRNNNTIVESKKNPIYGPQINNGGQIVLGPQGEIIGVNGRSLISMDGNVIYPRGKRKSQSRRGSSDTSRSRSMTPIDANRSSSRYRNVSTNDGRDYDDRNHYSRTGQQSGASRGQGGPLSDTTTSATSTLGRPNKKCKCDGEQTCPIDENGKLIMTCPICSRSGLTRPGTATSAFSNITPFVPRINNTDKIFGGDSDIDQEVAASEQQRQFDAMAAAAQRRQDAEAAERAAAIQRDIDAANSARQRAADAAAMDAIKKKEAAAADAAKQRVSDAIAAADQRRRDAEASALAAAFQREQDAAAAAKQRTVDAAAAAEARRSLEEAAAAERKRQEDLLAELTQREHDLAAAAIRRKEAEELAMAQLRKQEDEAAEAANRRQEEMDAAKRRREADLADLAERRKDAELAAAEAARMRMHDEAEAARRRQEEAEAAERRRREEDERAAELARQRRKQQEAEDDKRQAAAEAAARQRELEADEAARRRREAEEAAAAAARAQRDREAEEERRRLQEAADKERKRREMEAAAAERQRQAAEEARRRREAEQAELERQRQEEEQMREEQRKRDEAEAEKRIQQEEAAAERTRQMEREAEEQRKQRERTAEEAKRLQADILERQRLAAEEKQRKDAEALQKKMQRSKLSLTKLNDAKATKSTTSADKDPNAWRTSRRRERRNQLEEYGQEDSNWNARDQMPYNPKTASHTQMFDSGSRSIQSGRSGRCAEECFGVSDECMMGSRYSETARREDVFSTKQSSYTDSRGSGGSGSEYSCGSRCGGSSTRGLDGSCHRSVGGPNIDGSGLSDPGRGGFNRPDADDLHSSGRKDSNASNKQTKIKENNGSDGSRSEYSCGSRCGGSLGSNTRGLCHRGFGGSRFGSLGGPNIDGSGRGGFNRPDADDLHSSGRKDSNVLDMVPHPHCRRCCAPSRDICKVPKSTYYVPPRCFPSCCMQSYFRSPFCTNNCCPMPIRCLHLHYTLYRGNELPSSAQYGALAALNMDPKLKAFYDIMHRNKDDVSEPTAKMVEATSSTRSFGNSVEFDDTKQKDPDIYNDINSIMENAIEIAIQKRTQNSDKYKDINSILNSATDDIVEAQEIIIAGDGTIAEPPLPPTVISQQSQSALKKLSGISSMGDASKLPAEPALKYSSIIQEEDEGNIPKNIVPNAAPHDNSLVEFMPQSRSESRDSIVSRDTLASMDTLTSRDALASTMSEKNRSMSEKTKKPRSDKRASEASKPPKSSRCWEFIKSKCFMAKPPAKRIQSRSKGRENAAARSGNNRTNGSSKAAGTQSETNKKPNVNKSSTTSRKRPNVNSDGTIKRVRPELIANTESGPISEIHSSQPWTPSNILDARSKKGSENTPKNVSSRGSSQIGTTALQPPFRRDGAIKETDSINVDKTISKSISIVGIDPKSAEVLASNTKAKDTANHKQPFFAPSDVSAEGPSRKRPQSPKGRNGRRRPPKDRRMSAGTQQMKINTNLNKTMSTIIGPTVLEQARMMKAASKPNNVPVHSTKTNQDQSNAHSQAVTESIVNTEVRDSSTRPPKEQIKEDPVRKPKVPADSEEPNRVIERRSASQEILNENNSDSDTSLQYESSDSDDLSTVTMERRKARNARASIAMASDVTTTLFANIPDMQVQQIDEGKGASEKYMGLKATPKYRK